MAGSYEQTNVAEDFNYHHVKWPWHVDLRKSVQPHKYSTWLREINRNSCMSIICFRISSLEIAVALPTVAGKLCFPCIHRIWSLLVQRKLQSLINAKNIYICEQIFTYRMRAPFPIVCQLHPFVCCGLHLFALVILYLLIKNTRSVTTIRYTSQPA